MQIAEIDATNEETPQTVRTYLWDPSEPVATRILQMTLWANNTAGETLYYTHDLQKNVTALFGQAVERRAQYEYDPYGNPINTTGDAAALNPYRYSSEYHDEDLGLIYYNYRHYNPQDGRWINRDPIAEQGGINLYGFVGNNSMLWSDLLGCVYNITDADFDFEPCNLTLTIHVYFNFVKKANFGWRGSNGVKGNYSYTGREWSDSEKQQFKNKSINSMINQWNNKFKLGVTRQGEECCPCEDEGIQIKLHVKEDGFWSLRELELTVVAYVPEPDTGYPFEAYRAEGGGGRILMKEQGPNDLDKYWNNVLNHELGHVFGLHHPGYNRVPAEQVNTEPEYVYRGKDMNGNEVDGRVDLMGAGSGMRAFYYNKWADYMNREYKNSCKFELIKI